MIVIMIEIRPELDPTEVMALSIKISPTPFHWVLVSDGALAILAFDMRAFKISLNYYIDICNM